VAISFFKSALKTDGSSREHEKLGKLYKRLNWKTWSYI